MNETFGERIKNARKARGLTQKQLADKIGAKHNSVSDWENDKNKPSSDIIETLCEILEITPNYLLSISSEELTPAEKAFIKKYRCLDDIGIETVEYILDKEILRIEALKNARETEERSRERILTYEKELKRIQGKLKSICL